MRNGLIRQDINGYMAIAKVMEGHCSTVQGMAVYENGWSDQRVQQEVGGPERVSISSVQSVRKKVYGLLHRPHGDSEPKDESSNQQKHYRLAALALRIERLEAWARKVDPSAPGPLFKP